MFKKDELEEFLFLCSKADIFPFDNYEDAYTGHFNALDLPFPNAYYSIQWHYDLLKIEISENLLSLSSDDRLLYLNYLQDRLKTEVWVYDIKIIHLLKKEGIDTDDLDFEQNIKLKKLLNKSFKSVTGDKNLIWLRDVNREYYKYLINLKKKDIFEYIEVLVNKFQSKEVSLAGGKLTLESNEKANNIFKSEEGYGVFKFLLEKFEINTSTLQKRGIQAKLNAIWGCSKSKDLIFKDFTPLKDYVEFLNKTYGVDYNSRSMSDGSNYHAPIKNWLNELNNK